jgi:hypothetical protein
MRLRPALHPIAGEHTLLLSPHPGKHGRRRANGAVIYQKTNIFLVQYRRADKPRNDGREKSAFSAG